MVIEIDLHEARDVCLLINTIRAKIKEEKELETDIEQCLKSITDILEKAQLK